MVRWSEKPLRRFAYLTAALLVGWTGPRPAPAAGPQKDEETLPDFWVREDLDEGFARARREEKPLLIVFRCPP